MRAIVSVAVAGALLALALPALSDEANMNFGGDQYTAGQQAAIEAAVAGDAFIAGYNVSISAPVHGDAHLAGFNVSTTSEVTADAYAIGYSVSVGAPVGGDLTATGNSVVVGSGAPVGGNIRAAGQLVTLDAPISGSALVTARTLTLNAVVTGDLSFIGETLVFAPGARVDGQLSIHAPAEIAVPAAVAAADRVTYTRLVNPDYVGEAGRTAENVVKAFWPAVWAALGGIVLLFIIGAALIAFLPARLRALEVASEKRPFRTFGLGILTFASTLGLVLVAAITVIGLFALPFVLIYVFAACSIAYLAGAYLIALRFGSAFVAVDSNLRRLAILAVALVGAVLLGLIPVLGWLLSLAIAIYGFGVFCVVTMVSWSRRDAVRLGAATAPDSGPVAA